MTVRPVFIPRFVRACLEAKDRDGNLFAAIRALYESLSAGVPDVSVVIPAYNEEENIIRTLLSLCSNQTSYVVEIIVADNNSTDRTAELIRQCGVKYVTQPVQGITPTRNEGLRHATGKYVLNADADSIYPKTWIQDMVKPLERSDKVALTYGNFSFIPITATPRPVLFAYEYFADLSRLINRNFKDEAVNVYGFNSGFRRAQGLDVGGFDHPPGANEDGWLALKLRDKGYGKLHHVTRRRSLVWTTDRRIQMDGGLIQGTLKRLKRFLG